MNTAESNRPYKNEFSSSYHILLIYDETIQMGNLNRSIV